MRETGHFGRQLARGRRNEKIARCSPPHRWQTSRNNSARPVPGLCRASPGDHAPVMPQQPRQDRPDGDDDDIRRYQYEIQTRARRLYVLIPVNYLRQENGSSRSWDNAGRRGARVNAESDDTHADAADRAQIRRGAIFGRSGSRGCITVGPEAAALVPAPRSCGPGRGRKAGCGHEAGCGTLPG
jgi:hypothetical protein